MECAYNRRSHPKRRVSDGDILLDIAALKGMARLPIGYVVTRVDISRRPSRGSNWTIRSGNIGLLKAGHRTPLGQGEYAEILIGQPGPSREVEQCLAKLGVIEVRLKWYRSDARA